MSAELDIATAILDFHHPRIEALIEQQKWRELSEYDKIGSAYYYVRDTILFGYNSRDDLKASDVLLDGYGQCNTKTTLLMALLRALGIPCRFHGFTIDRDLQKGAIPGYLFWLSPQKIMHSWVEVLYEDRWIDLEGVILDKAYLTSVQRNIANTDGHFCGYGVATTCVAQPNIDWQGQSTYIQKQGIADDFGTYDCPDSFYRQHGVNLTGLKAWLYTHLIRHLINYNVNRIRTSIR